MIDGNFHILTSGFGFKREGGGEDPPPVPRLLWFEIHIGFGPASQTVILAADTGRRGLNIFGCDFLHLV
jgi:hypothetical protein